MRKVLVSADWHLRNNDGYGKITANGVNDFMKWRVKSVRDMIKKAKKIGAHLIVAGDIIDDRLVDAVTLDYSSKLVSEMASISFSILLEGNHGFDGKNNLHTVIKHWQHLSPVNVKIVTEPEVVHHDGISYYCIPAISNLNIEFESILKKLLKDIIPGNKRIAVIHGSVSGALYDSGQEAKTGVPKALLKKYKNNFNAMVLGDFHRHQKIYKNVWYTGSPLAWSLSDQGQRKGYQIIDLDENKVIFVESKTPKFWSLEWDIDNNIISPPLMRPQEFKGTLKNSVVVVKIIGPESKLKEIDDQTIKSALKEAGAWKISILKKKTGSVVLKGKQADKNLNTQHLLEMWCEQADDLPASLDEVVTQGLKYLEGKAHDLS